MNEHHSDPYTAYNRFHPQTFEKPAQEILLKESRLRFLAFYEPKVTIPHSAVQSPIVFLGGAFQSLASFKRETRQLMSERPVYLLELPGQGSNPDSGASLGFDDLADLLAAFVRKLGLKSIVPVGLSFGSAIAFSFAVRHSALCEKLILVGATTRLREVPHRQLEFALQCLQNKQMHRFATLCTNHLFNPYFADETRVSPLMTDGMAKKLKSMTPMECEKYRANTERILKVAETGLTGRPQCPTLVVSAEYDNFTSPFENLVTAQRCQQSVLVVLARGDHLSGITRPRLMTGLYRDFLTTGSIQASTQALAWLAYYKDGAQLKQGIPEQLQERRLYPRWEPEQTYPIRISGESVIYNGELLNINPDGCSIKIPGSVLQTSQKFKLEFILHGLQVPAIAMLPDADAKRKLSSNSVKRPADSTRSVRFAFLRDDSCDYTQFHSMLEDFKQGRAHLFKLPALSIRDEKKSKPSRRQSCMHPIHEAAAPAPQPI